MNREWFVDLRVKLGVAWKTKFGSSPAPAALSLKAWVLSELGRMGVRLIGDDLADLPYALHLEILAATEGDPASGPKGRWEKYGPLAARRLPGGSSSKGRRL